MSSVKDPKRVVLEFRILPLAFPTWAARLQKRFPGTQVENICGHPVAGMRVRITLPDDDALNFALATAEIAGWKVFAISPQL